MIRQIISPPLVQVLCGASLACMMSLDARNEPQTEQIPNVSVPPIPPANPAYLSDSDVHACFPQVRYPAPTFGGQTKARGGRGDGHPHYKSDRGWRGHVLSLNSPYYV